MLMVFLVFLQVLLFAQLVDYRQHRQIVLGGRLFQVVRPEHLLFQVVHHFSQLFVLFGQFVDGFVLF